MDLSEALARGVKTLEQALHIGRESATYFAAKADKAVDALESLAGSAKEASASLSALARAAERLAEESRETGPRIRRGSPLEGWEDGR